MSRARASRSAPDGRRASTFSCRAGTRTESRRSSTDPEPAPEIRPGRRASSARSVIAHTIEVRFAAVFLAFGLAAAAQDHTTWNDYGGAADSAQYSALNQID